MEHTQRIRVELLSPGNRSEATETKAYLILSSMTLTPYPPTSYGNVPCHVIVSGWITMLVHSFVCSLILYIVSISLSNMYVCSIYLPHIRYAVHAIRFRRACHPTNQQRTIEATVLYMCQKCTSIAMVYTEPLSLSLSLCSTLSLHIHSLTPCTEPLKQPRIAKAHPNC